jgi:poly-gamma-glutamate synthesis protein (capsule biosynthesis protein)
MATASSAGSLETTPDTAAEGLLRAAEAGADFSVAFVHWGENYSDISLVQTQQRVDLHGYDLVIGHGAHSLQPLAASCSTPAIYSLGNFIFGTTGRFSEAHPGFGLLVYTHLTETGFDSLEFRCIRTDNALVNFQPFACDSEESGPVFRSLHPNIQIAEDYAWLSLEP